MFMNNFQEPAAFAAKHKKEDIRAQSRSGGVFTAFSDVVLNQGGVVYGSVLDDKFTATHIRAESFNDRDRMRGSKYVQSTLGETFKQVKEDLIKDRKVLFSGTSCQIAGLHRFLGEEYKNLLCIDIVCHGVPSPQIWLDYLTWIGKGREISSVDFRNKGKFGWAKHIESVYFSNGESSDSSVFKSLFMSNYILRPACYKCPYKDIMHPGDITIADFWGINKAAPDFDDDKGVSLILVNNQKGQVFFEQIQRQIEYRKVDLNDCIQPALVAPSTKPSNREEFWNDVANKDFGYIVKRYVNESITKKVMRKIYKLLKNS